MLKGEGIYGFLNETSSKVLTVQSARFLQSVKFYSKTSNNWNRYLKQISVRIAPKELDSDIRS